MAIAANILLFALCLMAASAAPLTRTVRKADTKYKPDLGNFTSKGLEILNRKCKFHSENYDTECYVCYDYSAILLVQWNR